jgi:hypothetical protein
MSEASNLAAIRSVHAAAAQLTLACTQIVGPIAMALSLPEVKTLGEPVPDKMKRAARKIDRRKK